MKKFAKTIFKWLKTNVALIIVALIFLVLFIFDTCKVSFASGIINNFKAVSSTFTPTGELFENGGEISYVSYVFNMFTTQKDVTFSLPTTQIENDRTDHTLTYSYGGLIFSSAKGIVKSVGIRNDKKYIEIAHENGFVSVYEGVETLGVCANENIGQNCAIGMCLQGQEWSFCITKNGEKIKLDEVEWIK